MGGLKGFLKRALGIEQVNTRIDTVASDLASRVDATKQAVLTQVHDEHVAGLNWRIDQIAKELTVRMDESGQRVLESVRGEYTALPRFLFHQPLDYAPSTYPPKFTPLDTVPGEAYPIPGPADRMGYCPTDPARYLQIGKRDHDFLLGLMDKHGVPARDATVLDFGCSSGRVLRHFETEHRERGWKPKGVDVQALPVEWIRRHLPKHFEVSACSVFPHLPFEDNSLDAIYGISVFTHIKYLWDMWVQELRRVLKPGGLLLMSIHAEPAWEYYHRDRDVSYVKPNLPPEMLAKPHMEEDFLYYGDLAVSQVFWKTEIAREFWGRYMTVIDVLPPPPESFQSWMVCKKPG
jgi:SAM-dependent methyltransferase